MHRFLTRRLLPLAAAPALVLLGCCPSLATSPALTVGGSSLTGATIASGTTVTAAAAGTVKVKWVLDGSYVGADTSAPFTWPLTATPGSHELRARLYDAAGTETKVAASFTVGTASTAAPTPAPSPSPAPTPAPTPTPSPSPSTGTTVSTSAGLVTALAAAKPGAVIRLADGTYSTSKGFTVSTACTAVAPCSLVGGRGAVLDGGGPTGGYGLHLLGASYWTISGITVDDAAKGVVLDGSSHNTLTGLDVHDIGQEGIHLRAFSSDNTVSSSVVRDTGVSSPGYGEGVYVGSAKSNWATYTAGLPDTSDRNVITGNQISHTAAENVDIKEGTTGGTLSNNTFDGTGMSGENYADSWVDVKGNGWLITGNVGTHALTDGFQTHVAVTGWGQGNVFRSNVANTGSSGYGFNLQKSPVPNTVACSNTAPTAGAGLANVTCTP